MLYNMKKRKKEKRNDSWATEKAKITECDIMAICAVMIGQFVAHEQKKWTNRKIKYAPHTHTEAQT